MGAFAVRRSPVVISWLFGQLILTQGDGPAETTTTSSTESEDASGGLGGCNLYGEDGRTWQSVRITLAGPIPRHMCSSSWDLHEVEIWDSAGFQVALTADAPFGSSVAAANAVDGDLSTYWAGDHDVGAGCTCWDSSKIGSSGVTVTMPDARPISRLKITQGGDGNLWSVGRVKIDCGDQQGFASSSIYMGISRTSTTIECTTNGCTATHETPVAEWCDDAKQSMTISFVLMTVQLAWWTFQ